ncbi:MAG: GntR family transcriptional regulator [Lachnospiraceae bacterium]|nr:GntR family transcriptional regulator [Lachnospiraceae bacterium]
MTEHLNVSRSPVREALRQLVSDGLLIEVPNKGVYVKEFNVKDIEEIFDMRVMLEGYGIAHSKKGMTSTRLERLFEILKNLEASYEKGDLETYTRYDEQLHERIVRLGDNSLVNDTYERVRSMNQQFRVLSLTSERRFSESLEEHRTIVQSLAIGDVKTADLINRRHLELACNTVKEYLLKKEEEKEKEE